MGKEKREYPRQGMRLAVSYETMDDFLIDYTSNVSLGGIFLETEQTLPTDRPLQLQLQLPDGEVILAEGTIQWTSSEGVLPQGVGVHFTVLSVRNQRRIQRLIEDWEG